MLKIEYTNKMKRDVRLMRKRGKDLSSLVRALDILASQNPMPEQFHDHRLKGAMSAYRECHIEPNWLLVYQIIDDRMALLASGTGTHSDLFGE